jgi:zinc-finger of transposase IS204/IS1001/IS1096/IS1165
MQPRSGDVVMLGLAGFVVLGVAEVHGELEISVETTAVRVGCPACGVIAPSHGRRQVVVRDVDAFGRRVRLRWRKRIWRCHEPACPSRRGPRPIRRSARGCRCQSEHARPPADA